MKIKWIIPGKKETVLLLFIIAIAAWRVITFSLMPDNTAMSNFTPIGAMALFGGAYFTRVRAYLFPIITLWLSDIFLNRLVYYGEWILFYDDFYWTYLAFALMVLVGSWMKPNQSVINFAGSSMVIVFIHWIVTDIGVWLSGTLYPMTLEGFWLCLVAAIPYELSFLAGTVGYGIFMFGLFEWTKRKVPALQIDSL